MGPVQPLSAISGEVTGILEHHDHYSSRLRIGPVPARQNKAQHWWLPLAASGGDHDETLRALLSPAALPHRHEHTLDT